MGRRRSGLDFEWMGLATVFQGPHGTPMTVCGNCEERDDERGGGGNKPEDLRAWRDRAKPHFVVDDFQNLTRAEYLFLKTLVGSNGSLTVAGDRNQRIGTYRGADRELFDLFLRENPSAKHFRLLANYRLTQPLHDLAVALLPTAAPDGAEPGTVVPRLPKGQTSILIRFPGTPDEMGQSIAGLLTGYRAHGSSWGDIAVLCRRRSSVDRLSKSLSARGIPCRVWGDDRRQGRESSQHELTISTFHAAQGQQWDKVVIEDASDDMVPGSLELSNQDWLQEERRLLYVAVTRAAKTLAIFCCTKGGEGTESRFFTMGDDVLDRMSWGPPSKNEPEDGRGAEIGSPVLNLPGAV